MAYLLFLLLLLHSVVADDCQNPMFSDPIDMPTGENITLVLLPSPSTQIPFGSCGVLDGQPSCCNATTFAPIQKSLATFDSDFTVFLNTIKSATPEQIVNAVLQSQGWVLNTEQYNLAVEMAVAFQQLIDPSVQCMGGFLGYWQGMLCFSCYPNWENYYDPLLQSLNVLQSTCDSVYNDCDWFWEKYQETLIIWVDLLIQILELDTYHDWSSYISILQSTLNDLKTTSFCQLMGWSDCKSLTCDGLMHGLMVGTTSGQAAINELKNNQMVSTFMGMMPALKKPVALNFGATSSMSGIVHNDYTSTGYDAWYVGCSSNLSTYACPAAYYPDDSSSGMSGTSLALAIILPIFSVLLIGIGGYYIYKHRKPAEAVALDDNVHYAKLPSETGQTHEGQDVAFEPPVVPNQANTTEGGIQ